MPNAIIISMKTKWADLIYRGIKTLEIRTIAPFKKIEVQMPFKAYIYETITSGGAGLITGEFTCDCIITTDYYEGFVEGSCLSLIDLAYYAKGRNLSALHISSVTKYVKPIKLTDFGITRPPQSWCYVEQEVAC